MIKASVVGATGYTGLELIKILTRHPRVKISSLTTRSEEPVSLDKLIPSLPKNHGLKLETFSLVKVASNSDVIFLALPHTQAMDVAYDCYKAGKIVIDLSADFRIKEAKLYEVWYGHKHSKKELLGDAVYGLPEAYRGQIKKSQLIANPGCYATSILLGLKPALESRLVDTDSIVVDSKSGVSGAGKKLSETTAFCNVDENFSAYKVNQHQHTPEVEASLAKFAGKKVSFTFVPHLLPIDRGILSTIYLKKKKGISAKKIRQAFTQAYESEPFVRVRPEGTFPSVKDVAHTNFCDIGIWAHERSDRVIVISAIDNLLKGASGQAVQNMNIRCGFPEAMGLV
ncbi:MAG: N-acetyl-gamma-glutamyl-phosphate reductase [Candidatus Omnitrophica bacterium]|nr:N-acetyl-gamma-glutamyl-phosphate reductase [Candidatus Omnitrophota bacterium]